MTLEVQILGTDTKNNHFLPQIFEDKEKDHNIWSGPGGSMR